MATNYSGAYTPTLSNAPASSWTTDAEKRNHVGNTFLNTSSKNVYAFEYVGVTNVVKSATVGSVVSFSDAVGGEPLISAIAALSPAQSLNGYTKPWAAGAGVNKWEFGDVSITGTYSNLQLTTPLAAGTYTISTVWSTTSPSAAPQFRFRKQDASALISVTLSNSSENRRYATFTLNEAAYYVYAYSAAGTAGYTATITDTQIEAGSYMTLFQPYTNICPISGHTEAKLWVSPSYDTTLPATVSVELSKNKFTDFFTIGKNISGGTVVDRPANDRCATVDGCTVLAETQYTISFSGGGSVGVYYYDSTDTFISQESSWKDSPFTFTTPQNTARVRFSYNTGTPPTDVQLELGTTPTTYTAAIIYAGTYDLVTGKLKQTMANIASYNGETIGEPWLSSMDEYVSGNTPTTGAQVVYTLSTPVVITLTGQTIAALNGQNYVWADTGNITELKYTSTELAHTYQWNETWVMPKITRNNGTVIVLPYPQEYTPDIYDVDASTTGRNAAGTMIRDRVARKHKFNYKFAALTQAEVTEILGAVQDVSFTLTTASPETGAKTNYRVYCGDRSMPVYWMPTSNNSSWMYSTLSVNLIEM